MAVSARRSQALGGRVQALVRRRAGLLLAVLIALVAGYAVVESFTFPDEARRAPLVVAVPAGLGALALVVKEILSPSESADDRADGLADELAERLTAVGAETHRDTERAVHREPQEDAAAATGVSTAAAVMWVLVLTAMFLLFGLLLTIPLFTVAFMRLYGRERWRTILLTTAAVSASVYLFFVRLLEVRVFGGWLRQWLGLG